ncbi:MAG: 4Fe-4S dicluster domain-containing protein [Kiritimatiellae bacterium]|nr:4Fe-4S dicluster domain-containing protein [Kiritimatiellia bacterium]
MLKRIRVIAAALTFSLVSFAFIDFAGLYPVERFNLAGIQLIPALLASCTGAALLLLVLTLLAGRVYCSCICPLGVFQDLVSRVARHLAGARAYAFRPERKLVRYGVPVVVLVACLSGFALPLSLLEPYGAFGRMATHLLRPVYLTGNNVLAAFFNRLGNFTLYHSEVYLLSASSLLIAVATLGVTGLTAWRHGRAFCNVVCPVGTMLGLLSRFAIFRVRLAEDKCNRCGLCARACKASCIDVRNGVVDAGRCVACFNCLEVCRRHAIRYAAGGRAQAAGGARVATARDAADSCASDTVRGNAGYSRRGFLSALGAGALAAVVSLGARGRAFAARKVRGRTHPLSPPGSQSAARLSRHCTACHLCVARCPSRILRPAWLDYGPGGMMQPVMDFSRGFCNYDCTLCTEICPNGALRRLSREEKHRVQVGRAVFRRERCVVVTDGTHCGACSEHCPTQAVSMVPYKNGLTIPSVDADICVGCGGCEYACPARPGKAIYVEGNPVHLRAKNFEQEPGSDASPGGFGF